MSMFIEECRYADPKAWGAPNPEPRPRFSLEEWASRRLPNLSTTNKEQ